MIIVKGNRESLLARLESVYSMIWDALRIWGQAVSPWHFYDKYTYITRH